MDADGRVLDWNPAAESSSVTAKDEALGGSCLELIVPLPIDDGVQEVLRRIRAGDMDAHSVNENRTKDGRIITCEWFNTPLIEPDGTIRRGRLPGPGHHRAKAGRGGAAGERGAAAACGRPGGPLELRVGSHHPVGAAVGCPSEADVGAATRRARRPRDGDGRHPPGRPPGRRGGLRPGIDPAGDGGYAAEYRVIGIRDGVVRWVSARGRVTFTDGRPVRLVGAVMEITDHKRAVETLRTVNAALENAVEGIARLDMQGRYVSVNPAYAAMLGYRPEESGRHGLAADRAPDDLEKVTRLPTGSMLDDGRAEVEVLGVRKDRSVFWKQIVMVKAHDPTWPMGRDITAS